MAARDTSSGEHGVRRRTVLAGYAVWGVFWGGWGALLPAVKSLAGASDAALGVVLLCVAVGALPAMLLVGPLVDRFGNRALGASLGLFGLSILGIPAVLWAAASPWALGLALLLVGATSGAVDVTLNAAVAGMEAATGRRLFNQAHAAFPLAVVIASPCVGLARQAGITPFAILVVMGAVVLAVAVASVRGQARGQRRTSPARPRPRMSRALLLLGLVGAGIHVIESAVEQWSAIFLEGSANAGLGGGLGSWLEDGLGNGLGAAPAVASLGPAVYMGMLFVGRLLAHAYGQSLSARRILAVTALAAMAGMTMAAVAPHPALAIAGFAVAGLGMAAGMPTIFAVTGRAVAAADRGAAIGTVTAVAYGGYLLGPPFVGGLAGAVGLRGAWLALALVAFLLLVACRGIEPGTPRRH